MATYQEISRQPEDGSWAVFREAFFLECPLFKRTLKLRRAAQHKAYCEVLEHLTQVITAMSKRLVDRDEVVRLLVLAVVAKQHILLFGPPGTAKSYVAHLLSQFLYDTHEDFGGLYFEAQFHPSTTVEDIFGPTSLNDLRQGRIRRNVNSMLLVHVSGALPVCVSQTRRPYHAVQEQLLWWWALITRAMRD